MCQTRGSTNTSTRNRRMTILSWQLRYRLKIRNTNNIFNNPKILPPFQFLFEFVVSLPNTYGTAGSQCDVVFFMGNL